MRIYNSKFLSVTSIIGLRDPFNKKAFSEWCKTNGHSESLIGANSRALGSKVGRWVESHSLGLTDKLEPRFDRLEENLYSGVEKFVKDYKILETEKEVTCGQLNYAGKLDAIIQDKKTKKKLLVDFKTYGAWRDKPYKRDSKKIKHARWQTSLYAHALDWKDKLGVVVFTNRGECLVESFEIDKEIIKWVEDNQDLILETIDKGLTSNCCGAEIEGLNAEGIGRCTECREGCSIGG